jgi:pilus assembly protein CpaE
MLLTVTQDAQVVRDVAEAIGPSGIPTETCASLDQLTRTLDQNKMSAVVVDIDGEPLEVLADLEPILDNFPLARTIVIASEQRHDWMLRAMQAGARHFLVKSAISKELLDVLQRLMPVSPAGERALRQGVVTILSAGGGCGATTLAVNLAGELHRVSDHRSLLVDLDYRYGGVAGYLGVKAPFGVANVLADHSCIDADLVRSTAARYSERLHVLVSPATVYLLRPEELQYEQMSRVLRSARQAYQYTVVDAPGVSIEVAADLARASELTVIVLELNVEDIRIARALLEALLTNGIAADRIVAIVNRYSRRRQMVPWGEAKRALKAVHVRRLSNDYAHAAASSNYGKPLAEVAPRSRLRREIQSLAKAIHSASANGKQVQELW